MGHRAGGYVFCGCMPSKTLIYSAEVLLSSKGKRVWADIQARVSMEKLHQRKLDTIKNSPTTASSTCRAASIISIGTSQIYSGTVELDNGDALEASISSSRPGPCLQATYSWHRRFGYLDE